MNSGRRDNGAGPAASRGQSVVELAIVLPVLALLLLLAADFGRVMFLQIAVSSAARAGAQYGSRSLVTAANAAGMIAAAKTDGADVTDLTASAAQCTCAPSQTVSACPSGYCAANPQATYVEVDTRALFRTLVAYPGIPSSMELSGRAVMQVQR